MSLGGGTISAATPLSFIRRKHGNRCQFISINLSRRIFFARSREKRKLLIYLFARHSASFGKQRNFSHFNDDGEKLKEIYENINLVSNHFHSIFYPVILRFSAPQHSLCIHCSLCPCPRSPPNPFYNYSLRVYSLHLSPIHPFHL